MGAGFKISHFNSYGVLESFSDQIYLDNDVVCSKCLCLNEDLCILYLDFHSFSVAPIYVFMGGFVVLIFGEILVCTSAL